MGETKKGRDLSLPMSFSLLFDSISGTWNPSKQILEDEAYYLHRSFYKEDTMSADTGKLVKLTFLLKHKEKLSQVICDSL